MRNVLYALLTCLSVICYMPVKAQTTFQDIKLNLMKGNFLTAEEIASEGNVAIGVAIAA